MCFCAGKTTFIKHLLGREYPGIHIGPEPTTDRFVVVMHGLEERRTPGNTLIVQPDKPYQVQRLYASYLCHQMLFCPKAWCTCTRAEIKLVVRPHFALDLPEPSKTQSVVGTVLSNHTALCQPWPSVPY